MKAKVSLLGVLVLCSSGLVALNIAGEPAVSGSAESCDACGAKDEPRTDAATCVCPQFLLQKFQDSMMKWHYVYASLDCDSSTNPCTCSSSQYTSDIELASLPYNCTSGMTCNGTGMNCFPKRDKICGSRGNAHKDIKLAKPVNVDAEENFGPHVRKLAHYFVRFETPTTPRTVHAKVYLLEGKDGKYLYLVGHGYEISGKIPKFETEYDAGTADATAISGWYVIHVGDVSFSVLAML